MGCPGCSGCPGRSGCSRCSGRSECSGFSGSSEFSGCSGFSGGSGSSSSRFQVAKAISKTCLLKLLFGKNSSSRLEDQYSPQQQSQVSSRALPKAAGIERIVIENGGTNYDAADAFTITIEGDGTGAAAVDGGVTVSGGAITAIELSNVGTDYTKAKVTITHDNASGGAVGSGCIARAVIAPAGGHGTDPVSELGAFFVSLNVQLDNSDDSDLTTGNDFRQITIVKNPYSAGTTLATASVLKATKALNLASGQSTSGFVVDQVIQAASGGSGAKAYLVEIDSTNGKLYYYQNEKTGYTPFAQTDTVQGTLPSGGSATLASSHITAAGVVAGSGQVIFLENRDPISRSATQIEDIKCIIEF